MGVYDIVLVPCPRCGDKLEFQSKSGLCTLTTYELHEAPPDVLQDVNRHAPGLCECGTQFYVHIEQRQMVSTVATPKLWPEESPTTNDEELEFLQYFYNAAYDLLGPANDDIVRDIKEAYKAKTGKEVPEGY